MADETTLAKTVRTAKIKHVMLHFTDILGRLRGRTIAATEAAKALEEGIGFDGSSIPGLTQIGDSDMIMKPDPTTLVTFPTYFYNRPIASLICDIFTPEKNRSKSDPRYICQSTTKKMQKDGYYTTAAAELEFYLTKNEKSTIEPVENHVKENPRYFDISPVRDVTEHYRMDLCEVLTTFKIAVERQHHEAGSAQNEVTFKYSSPTETSDNITRTKFAAKAIAYFKYGWVASFMPKPWTNRPGNGMHIHLGLLEKASLKNIFFDSNEYANISQTGRYFIGGILSHAKALSAIVAPAVNSYKRLVRGFEAPVYVAWGKRNRSALIRIPQYFPEKKSEARIEFRCPDPLCNPYIAYATLLEAGMDGVKKKTEPPPPTEENTYKLTKAQLKKLGIKTLPSSLKEALEEWKSDEICIKTLGKENADAYVELKMQEWKEYKPHIPSSKNQITSWEMEKYLFA